MGIDIDIIGEWIDEQGSRVQFNADHTLLVDGALVRSAPPRRLADHYNKLSARSNNGQWYWGLTAGDEFNVIRFDFKEAEVVTYTLVSLQKFDGKTAMVFAGNEGFETLPVDFQSATIVEHFYRP